MDIQEQLTILAKKMDDVLEKMILLLLKEKPMTIKELTESSSATIIDIRTTVHRLAKERKIKMISLDGCYPYILTEENKDGNRNG